MDVKISRRQLALAVTTAAAVAGNAQAAPAPQTAPQSPQDELAAVRQQNATNQEALAKFDIAQAVEPAVHFRA
jgi:hypothetical protein